MAIPPSVSAEQADAAIERIVERRRRIDDPNAWRLSDAPMEVLDYLRKYSQGVPAWVREADVLDGLELRLFLWWSGETIELWLLEQAERLGVPPRLVGQRLGIRSRQGVHDRRRASQEKVARLRGQPAVVSTGASGPDQRQRGVELEWIARHQAQIRSAAAVGVAHIHLADEEAADWLAEVGRDLREGASTPGALQLVRFALAALSSSPEVRTLQDSHPLQEALARWSELFSTYPGGAR
ncbi:hypothetical protein GCM10023175_53560 [Pseudonocardia xishanensis]|uniref:Uncharacterized protein n=1 Tax=Pseudonocardia xishanensis TaxID=630995 RepID=A0ABP8S0K1_9PSEU